jgi:hypothetical protein
VADRFVVSDGGPRRGQLAGLAADWARRAAARARLLRAERAGLLLQGGRQGALGQAEGRGAGDLLHGVEVHVEAGALLAEGAAGHDFAPAGGQVTDFLEEFGRKFASRHGRYCLVLAAEVWEEFLSMLYDTPLGLAKLLMASGDGF